MSGPTSRAVSQQIAQQADEILALWTERAQPLRGAGEAARGLIDALARGLEGEPSAAAVIEIGKGPLRGRSVLEAVSAIENLQEIVLEVLESELALTYTDRMAVLGLFSAWRTAMAEETQVRQDELERAAVRSEERYLTAARAAGFAIWDWDLNEQEVAWNRNVESLLGHPSEALSTSEAWLEHVHPADRQHVEASLRGALEEGCERWSEKFRFLCRDGTYMSVLGRAWISHDRSGRATRIIGGLIDVTEQRQLARQLEEQVLLTRTVAENATSCLFLLDRRGCATYMNPAAVQLTGYTLEEIRDTPFPDLMSPLDEHGASSLDECPVHRHESAFRDHECTFVRKDGTRVPVACSLTPLSGSTTGGAVLEFRDIGEIRRSQAALREAVRVRDDFLSIASHELRTPMTALRMQIQGMIKGPQFSSLDERVKARIHGAERSTLRMVQLVNELLDVSRLAAGHLELDLEDMNLVEVIHDVIDRMQPEIARSSSELTLSAPERAVGYWDKSRIDQIVSNLLSNALKYGEGKPIEISLEANEERALLRVRDHGIGIAPDEQAHIFERFARAVSQRHFGGFGLGLWIVQRVLDMLNGSIRVESELGKGATFEICLPLRSPARAQQEGSCEGQK